MFKYLFANGNQQRSLETPDGAVTFSYHKDSAIQALLGGFLMAAIIEATVIHVLLAMWNHWIATAATLSTLWFGLQVVSQIRAVAMRPIYYRKGILGLRNGVFDIADVSIRNIEYCEVTSTVPKLPEGGPQPFNVTFPASHNLVIGLKEAIPGKILNRSSRNFVLALLAIDEPERLAKLICDEKKLPSH